VKVLAMPADAKPEVMERFDREVRALQSMSHPHVVELVDFGKLEGTGLPFIVLEWIEGQRLGKHIREHGALSLEETWAITRQLLEALTAVHDAGYVHRDVSSTRDDFGAGRAAAREADRLRLVKPRPGHYQAVTRPGVIVALRR